MTKNILIVDDKLDNRDVLEVLIRSYAKIRTIKFKIWHATNGQEAVALAKEHSFDIILMDIIMPVMHGIEAIRHIRRFDMKCYIICASAYDDESKIEEAFAAGANDYFTKPVVKLDFFIRLKHAIMATHIIRAVVHNNKISHFREPTYKRHIFFKIDDEESLAQFWEFISCEDGYIKVEGTCRERADIINKLFHLIETKGLKKKNYVEIYIEESDTHYFLTTMLNNTFLTLEEWKYHLQFFESTNVMFASNQFTLRLNKKSKKIATSIQCHEDSSSTINSEIENNNNDNDNDSFDVILPKEIYFSPIEYSEDYKDYKDYIAHEDIDELNDILEMLERLHISIFSNRVVNPVSLSQFAEYLSKFGGILLHYTLFSDVGGSLAKLSQTLVISCEQIQNNYDSSSDMFYALLNVLHQFIAEIFEKNAPNPIVFNESIQNDIGMIIDFISPPKVEADDDLFFF